MVFAFLVALCLISSGVTKFNLAMTSILARISRDSDNFRGAGLSLSLLLRVVLLLFDLARNASIVLWILFPRGDLLGDADTEEVDIGEVDIGEDGIGEEHGDGDREDCALCACATVIGLGLGGRNSKGSGFLGGGGITGGGNLKWISSIDVVTPVVLISSFFNSSDGVDMQVFSYL